MTQVSIQLLMIPGLACDRTVWEPQLAHFARQHHLATDVADLGEHESTEAMARALLDRYLGKVAVAGFSLGGYVAQEMARQAPERILGLALMSTQAGTDPPAMADVRAGWAQQARREGMAAIAPIFLPKLASANYLASNIHKQALFAMMERHSVEAFCAEQEAIRTRSDCSQAVRSLRCPTLAVIPTQDALVPPTQQHKMVESSGIQAVHEVADSGHTVMLESPRAVNAAMQSWLDQIRSAAVIRPH
ncbi:MAG: alpha/beta hydrolase [Ramlibacter sp.]|uniref:alpha/beta fold hydrolase n=1 Tax=Ramlibacter sp. TaxID=1917967 RepID=UPI002609E426|nr:alpha/beta hydrolase [Ramlibacter sp.]MDH4377972.1 alpha/beta hydrolase [Ramlibacter sp.]